MRNADKGADWAAQGIDLEGASIKGSTEIDTVLKIVAKQSN
ncbi:MAG TPA: hypothetical protein VE641_00935 [Chthoniobacterales bacterium]|nr:hypothetical protein [Chthoniobacterales bacterium]